MSDNKRSCTEENPIETSEEKSEKGVYVDTIGHPIMREQDTKIIPKGLYDVLDYLGLIPSEENNCRSHNIGASNYSQHTIQPWSIWLDYPELTSWDHDIIKRVLRTKEGDSRRMDYEKIIHICEERLRQLKFEANDY